MNIKENMKLKNLSEYATKDEEAIRFLEEQKDIRPNFFRDIDKVLYTKAYTRYIDKTQVFSFNNNDHISKRMIHVQFVSKIARTIGRALGLNIDLIEAASLGHDLGHVPFGHVGEKILNKISLENNEGYFNHNIESVRLLMFIEDNGEGKNVSLQVLDAIMCHNGEFLQGIYEPKKKSKEEFLNEYYESYKDEKIIKKMKPMTLEGCVVRISDVIGYIGRDIEDAITLGLIKREDIPNNVKKVLGSTNTEIINSLVNDIIKNSFGVNYIKMSNEVYQALEELKNFNYNNIYLKAYSDDELVEIENMFKVLFENYLNDIKNNNINSDIFKIFLNDMTQDYLNNTSKTRKVIDYIAGMTDDYFISSYKKIV